MREGVSFLEMCADVERAVEVSLQPIDLVGAEAVILFSDIFTPVPAMGVDLDFQPGPVIAEPIRSAAQVEALRVPDPRESVPFVFEILRTLRVELASRAIPLLGFAARPSRSPPTWSRAAARASSRPQAHAAPRAGAPARICWRVSPRWSWAT